MMYTIYRKEYDHIGNLKWNPIKDAPNYRKARKELPPATKWFFGRWQWLEHPGTWGQYVYANICRIESGDMSYIIGKNM